MNVESKSIDIMEKPITVKWIGRLLLFRLIVVFVIVIITIAVVYINPEKGFFTGFANAILRMIDVHNPYENPAATAGHMMGAYFVPVIIIICEYTFLRTKMRIGFWGTYVFDFLSVLINYSLPLIPIAILVLGLRKSTRLYFTSVKNIS